MPTTQLSGNQIKDGDIKRADLNTSQAGSAVITKIIAGSGISIVSTGADAGTGDVTITATGGGGGFTYATLAVPHNSMFEAVVTLNTTCAIGTRINCFLVAGVDTDENDADDVKVMEVFGVCNVTDIIEFYLGCAEGAFGGNFNIRYQIGV